jgi:MarR family transcriptional regulator, organic hydroperoxide resistance regulator
MKEVPEHELFELLTGKISSTINKALLRKFAQEKVEITTEQWTVMTCLWNQDKVTQQTLSTLTQKDKPSITRLIDNLEKRQYVVRVSDPSDRRINLIHLTKAGTELQSRANEIVRNVAEAALLDINENELELFRLTLKKIMNNLK